jgi:hypothetical protein
MSSDWFGIDMASAGDVDGDGYPEVVVNDMFHAFIVAGGPAGLSAPVLITTGSIDTVLGAGDVDGDGYADVVVGVTLSNAEDGALDVYRGGPGGLAATPVTLAMAKYGFGRFVATSDVNGDGYGDVVAAGGAGIGYIYFYAGGPGGPSTTPVVLQASMDNLVSVGDVNGDGYGDLAISGIVPTDAGNTVAAFVLLGGPAGPSTPQMFAPPSTPFNTQLAAAGDVDGDGYADVLVGVGPYGVAPTAVQVYYGAPSPALPAFGFGYADWPRQGFYDYVVFSGIGDVNGDGLADSLVGLSSKQSSYLYLGQKRNRPQQPSAQTLEGSTSVL